MPRPLVLMKTAPPSPTLLPLRFGLKNGFYWKESVFSRPVHSVVSHPPRGDLNWQHFPTPGPAPTPRPVLLLLVDPSGSEGSHGGVPRRGVIGC